MKNPNMEIIEQKLNTDLQIWVNIGLRYVDTWNTRV
jgi:hypothetical protein